MQAADPNLPTLQGARWRATHRASVTAILGAEAPPVFSKGTRFYNVDRWTVRFFVKLMCDWAKKNPTAAPLKSDVETWVREANAEKLKESRRIVIATTPEKLSLRTALALVGGGYHEALHTRFSCRTSLNVKAVADIVLPRWVRVPDWSKFYGLLQEWNNLVEDIRIERRGNEDYVGIFPKMCELQDFILGQEATDRRKVVETLGQAGMAELKKPLPVIAGSFRDIGLGYPTHDQADALKGYAERNLDAFNIVDSGPLRGLVEEAIDLTREDVLGCLRVAMDVIIELVRLVDPEELQKASDQAAGCGAKPKCPKCGAPGKDLVVRPLSDGNGGIVKGRGVITCTKCGWQEVVDLKPSSGGGSGQGSGSGKGQGQGSGGSGSSERGETAPSDPDDAIKFDPTPAEIGNPTGSGKEPGEEGGGDCGSGDEGEGEGDAPNGGSGESEGEGDGKGEGGGKVAGKGGAGTGGAGTDGDNDDSGGDGDGKTSGDVEGDGPPSGGAGGHHWDPERAKAWAMVAAEALDDAKKGKTAGLRDVGSALEEAFKGIKKKEDASCAKDEKPWRPYNYDLDVVELVEPSDAGIADDRQRASALLASVKSECSYLRARLRAIVRAVEQRAIVHGTPKGREISERMLVDSKADLAGGRLPRRAYYTISDKVDTSIAAVAVIDESSSMTWPPTKLQDATRCLIAITEPLDFLGASTLVAGFRDGPNNLSAEDYASLRESDYHRVHGVCIDVFKSFNERFSAAKWRFANTRGVGGTPMADGVQFGLDALNARPEAHRVLFIVTDGEPNPGHEPVITRQIRLAKEAGIVVIGVGIGQDSRSVMSLFPDHVWAPSVTDMPKEIVKKLNEVLDFRGIKKRRALKKTG